MNIRCIDAGSVSGFRSQAIYHGLGYAQTQHTPNTVVLATPEDPYMCIGFFQDVENELDLTYCKNNNLPVIRRETGGGAVYIDNGQLFVQWIFQQSSLPRRVDQRFQLFVKPLIETYKFFGINAYYHPINDVHVNGKKIVGTGAGTIGDGEIVTGNLMFDFNYNTMIDAINAPTPAFREAVRRNMKKFLTNMKLELGELPPRAEVVNVYRKNCEACLGLNLVDGEFTSRELKAMEQAEEKFKQSEWLFQIKRKAPNNKLFKIHLGLWVGYVVHPLPQGEIRVLLTLQDNRITELQLHMVNSEPIGYQVAGLQQELTGLLMDEEILSRSIQKLVPAPMAKHWLTAIYTVKEMQLKQTGHGTVARRN